MNSIDPISQDLKDALELKPMRAELADRVGRLRPAQTRRVPWFAMSSAFAAAGGVAAVILFLGAPRRALADEILQAARHVHGHVSIYAIGSNGSRTLMSESWADGGLSRTSSGPHGEIRQEFVDTDKDRVVVFSPTGPSLTFWDKGIRNNYAMPQELTSGDLGSIVRHLQAFRSGPPKTGQTTFEGRSADFVEIDLKTDLQRTQEVFYADPIDHHILGFHAVTWNSPKLQAMARSQHAMMRLGGLDAARFEVLGIVDSGAIPAHKLKPVFRINGRDVDVYQVRDAIRDRLTRAKLASCTPGGYNVRVRDLARNPDGDLFVLYTAGSEPPSLGFSAEDGVGGVYLMDGVSSPAGPAQGAILIDGEVLQFGWLAHGSGPVSSRPIRLKFWTEGTGKSQTAEVSLVPSAIKGELPDYSLYLSVPQSANFDRERLGLVAEALTRSQQYGAAVPVLRKAIAAVVQEGQESAWMREELGHCLTMIHRYPEALVELKKAEKVAEGMNPGQADRIKDNIRHLQAEAIRASSK